MVKYQIFLIFHPETWDKMIQVDSFNMFQKRVVEKKHGTQLVFIGSIWVDLLIFRCSSWVTRRFLVSSGESHVATDFWESGGVVPRNQ